MTGAVLRSVPAGSGQFEGCDLEDYEIFMMGGGFSDKRRVEAITALKSFRAFLGMAVHLARPIDASRFLGRGHLSPGSRHTYFGVLAAYFTWHCHEHPERRNPLSGLPRPKQPKGIPKPLTNSQLEKLLLGSKYRKTQAMILLAALAGLRVHEIAKIRGEDVDLDEKSMFVYGKGQKEARIPLHPLLIELANTMPRNGFWFPANSRGSGCLRPNSVSKVVAMAMERADVPGSAHSLRHWYATSLVRSGVDLRTVQSLMRHGSLATTQRYVLVDEAAQEDAIGRLVLPGVPTPSTLDSTEG